MTQISSADQDERSRQLYQDLAAVVGRYSRLGELLKLEPSDEELLLAGSLEFVPLFYARYLRRDSLDADQVVHQFFGEFTRCVDRFTKANGLIMRGLVRVEAAEDIKEPFKNVKTGLWTANNFIKQEVAAGKAAEIHFFRAAFKDPSKKWLHDEIQPVMDLHREAIVSFAQTLGDEDEGTAHYVNSGDCTHNGLMSLMRMWHKVKSRPHPKALDDCANQIVQLIGGYLKRAGIARGEVVNAFSGNDYAARLQDFWDTGHQMVMITTAGFPNEVVDQIYEGRSR